MASKSLPIHYDQQCSNCRFVADVTFSDNSKALECRRRDPRLGRDGQAQWPLVTAVDWCGRWAAAPKAKS